MAGRGPQTFKKRQKEQARKEKQLEKRAKRLERKRLGPTVEGDDLNTELNEDRLTSDSLGVDDLNGESSTPPAEDRDKRP